MSRLPSLLVSVLLLTLVSTNCPASTSSLIQTDGCKSAQTYLTAPRSSYSGRPHRGIGRRERLAVSTPGLFTLPTGTA